MERFFATILIFVAPGLFIIVFHLRLLSGKGNKSFYMADHIYAGRVYAAIPFGMAFLIFALAAIPQSPDISLAIVGIGIGFGVFGLICAFIQPSFLKPAWFKWLEREHGEIMSNLRAEVRRMGDRSWNEQIQTQEDLEQWVAEVRRKHAL